MRNITAIIIHCSATKADQDFTIEDIRTWHVKGNRWADVGYHFVIRLDGTVEFGRDIDRQGAGVKGKNADTIHICYVGGLNDDGQPADTMTDLQYEAMQILCVSLVKVLGPLDVIGHNELNPAKACPSFDVSEKFPELVQWCQNPGHIQPESNYRERQPAQVVTDKFCRRCHRRMRM